jgi:hypothetical protein
MNISPTAKRTLVLTAWAVMLLVSDLPNILITNLGGTIPSWMFRAKTGFLAAFLVLTLLSVVHKMLITNGSPCSNGRGFCNIFP